MWGTGPGTARRVITNAVVDASVNAAGTLWSMTRATVVVRVDRDSVAAGDDVVSHRIEVVLPTGTLLSDAVERCAPGIRVPGWSWIALLDGVPVAVWSADQGVQLVVGQRRLDAGAHDLRFRYAFQIDAGWLRERLARGETANLKALRDAYAPFAAVRRRASAPSDPERT